MGTNDETHDKSCQILVIMLFSCCGMLMPLYALFVWIGNAINYGVMMSFKKAHTAFATTAEYTAAPWMMKHGMPPAPQTAPQPV